MELSDYLKIGEVCEVQGKTIRAGVYSDKNTEYLNHKGTVLKNVGIGSFVLIRKGFNNIIGKVEGEYTRDISTDKAYAQMGNSIKRIISISVLGSLNRDRFVHGLTELPLIGNFVYILEEEVISKIFSFNSPDQTIRLGMVIGHDDYPFEIGAQDLICSHIGIFGNTGSGKSNTLAKLYNEIISKYEKYRSFKRNSKFVVFDFNGEYGSVFTNADVYSLSTRKSEEDDVDFITGEIYRYPIVMDDMINPDFWAIILEATEKTQKPFIKRTIKKFNQIKDGQTEFSIEHFCELIIKTQAKYSDLKYTIGDVLDVFGLKDRFDEFDAHFNYNGQTKQFYTGYGNYQVSAETIQSTLFEDISFDADRTKRLNTVDLFEFAIKYN